MKKKVSDTSANIQQVLKDFIERCVLSKTPLLLFDLIELLQLNEECNCKLRTLIKECFHDNNSTDTCAIPSMKDNTNLENKPPTSGDADSVGSDISYDSSCEWIQRSKGISGRSSMPLHPQDCDNNVLKTACPFCKPKPREVYEYNSSIKHFYAEYHPTTC